MKNNKALSPKISAKISCTDTTIKIETPLGATLDLDSVFDIHFQACIRESCRYAIINGLIERSNKKDEPQRKDMIGIEPYVDLSATMAMLNSNKNPNEEVDSEGGKS